MARGVCASKGLPAMKVTIAREVRPPDNAAARRMGSPFGPCCRPARIVTDLMRDTAAKLGGAREIPSLVLGEFSRVGELLEPLLGRPCSEQMLRAKLRGNRFG